MPVASGLPRLRNALSIFTVGIFALSALFAAQPALAQPRLLLFLGNGPTEHHCMDELRAGLEKAGWSFGEQLTLELHDAGGDETRLAELARMLAARGPAMLLATEAAPTAALLKATREIPIVVIGASNLRTTGAVDEHGRPLANATGVTLSLSGQHTTKPFEVLLQTFPGARRIGMIENHGNPLHKNEVQSIKALAQRAGIEVVRAHFAGAPNIAAAWDELARQQVEAVMIRPDSPVHLAEHARQALRVRLPTASHHMDFARHGGLLSYGVVGRTRMCPRGAHYVDQLLRGRSISDLPVEELFEAGLTLNLATAERLGLNLPKTVISRADRLIR